MKWPTCPRHPREQAGFCSACAAERRAVRAQEHLARALETTARRKVDADGKRREGNRKSRAAIQEEKAERNQKIREAFMAIRDHDEEDLSDSEIAKRIADRLGTAEKVSDRQVMRITKDLRSK